MQNKHLLPELIINLVDQYKKATRQNEAYSHQLRLEAIKEYVTEALKVDGADAFIKTYENKEKKEYSQGVRSGEIKSLRQKFNRNVTLPTVIRG